MNTALSGMHDFGIVSVYIRKYGSFVKKATQTNSDGIKVDDTAMPK